MARTLENGLYLQLYRGGMSAEQRADLPNQLDKFKQLGVKGIAWHGFSIEMLPNVFENLTKLCTDRGLLSLAAFGMGTSDHIGMATRMGHVALVPDCTAVVFDMEGAFDQNANQIAKEIGQTFRGIAPNILTIDQAWFKPTVHMGFPWVETAEFIDVRAPQVYCQDFKQQLGKQAYQEIFKEYNDAWHYLETNIYAPKNLIKERMITIQGYQWQYNNDWDVANLVNCLTTYDKILMWCEPYPTQSTINAIMIKNKLASLNFTGPDAVLNFQKSTNGKLTADNVCGPLTQKELGF